MQFHDLNEAQILALAVTAEGGLKSAAAKIGSQRTTLISKMQKPAISRGRA